MGWEARVASRICRTEVGSGPDDPGAVLLASSKVTRVLGVSLHVDGAFVLPRVADGAFRFEVRNGAAIVAARNVTVVGHRR